MRRQQEVARDAFHASSDRELGVDISEAPTILLPGILAMLAGSVALVLRYGRPGWIMLVVTAGAFLVVLPVLATVWALGVWSPPLPLLAFAIVLATCFYLIWRRHGTA